MKRVVGRVDEEAQKIGLRISEDKSKYMAWTENETNGKGHLHTKLISRREYIIEELLFASGTWMLYKRDSEMARIQERKILRKIYGGRRSQEERTNRELMELFD